MILLFAYIELNVFVYFLLFLTIAFWGIILFLLSYLILWIGDNQVN